MQFQVWCILSFFFTRFAWLLCNKIRCAQLISYVRFTYYVLFIVKAKFILLLL